MDTLEIKGVSKRYRKMKALDHISIMFPGNSTIALLGPNGAGKTTLMRILATLLQPDQGKIKMGNLSWDRSNEVKRQLGFLPQNFSFYPYLTVKETIAYVTVLKKLSKEQQNHAVEEILEETNLTDCVNKQVRELSGGMKRRLGIAQALLGEPQLLLVDEPTAGLDPEERIRFRNLLIKKSQGRLTLLSTHLAEDAEAICSQVALIDHGKIYFYGSVYELKAQAEGHIFETELSHEDYQLLAREHTVITFRPLEDGSIYIRYIANDTHKNVGREIKPTLEDAYMFLIGAEAGGRNAESHG